LSSATIIFPHQLFRKHPALVKGQAVILAEEYLFFHQYQFHQQKLVLHRACMKMYEHYLQEKGYQVTYISAQEPENDIRLLIPRLGSMGITHINIASLCDNWLETRLRKACEKAGIGIKTFDTPGFINTPEEGMLFFKDKKRYFQTDFYIDQRKKRNILLEADGKPLGGKWSFDAENRVKLPKGMVIPSVRTAPENKWIKEAKQYVHTYFLHNYGQTDPCFYPVTFADADNWLQTFFRERFNQFGIYEDAMAKKEQFLFHSLLTPLLNTGLLTPAEVVEQAIEAAIEYETPLNSLEGFIRQILGWREFIRIVYQQEGSKQRTTNFWNFNRTIPKSFWTGETGIHPVDTVVKRLLSTAYNHHIERLMVMGNFMLLCEFHPDEVYRWFMEMYIDAYDWVMVPNVYGMSQFADGGLMCTKPYISGSNYLMKMSDFDKGSWQETWDGLFWRFMHVHRDFFTKNPRLGMLVSTFDKMDTAKRNKHLHAADSFLNKL
jgi:deoxyribodipyrimidine photolyase-related protein